MMGAFYSFEGPFQSYLEIPCWHWGGLQNFPSVWQGCLLPDLSAMAPVSITGSNKPEFKQVLILLLVSSHGLCAQTPVDTNARHVDSRALAPLARERAAGLGTEQRQHLQVLLYSLPGCMEEVPITSCWDPVTGHTGMVQSCIRGSSNLVLVILAAYIQCQVPLTQLTPRLQLNIWRDLEC